MLYDAGWICFVCNYSKRGTSAVSVEVGTLIDSLYTQGRLTGEEVAAASLAAGPG